MRDAVLQPLLYEGTVGQACQRIMQSHLLEFDIGAGEFLRAFLNPLFQFGIQGLQLTLIGLPNRTLIQERLKYSIAHAKRDGRGLSIMMLDLDRFKEINDTLGHHAGDQVLMEIAVRLTALLRE